MGGIDKDQVEDFEECIAAWQESASSHRPDFHRLQFPGRLQGIGAMGQVPGAISPELGARGIGIGASGGVVSSIAAASSQQPRCGGRSEYAADDSQETFVRSDHAQDSFGPVLSINVGGEIFRTTVATLRKAPFFDSMLKHAEKGVIGSTVDGGGRFFVDRPGELFGYVLEFLRSGHWVLHDRARDLEFIHVLREEARFYGLEAGRDRLPVPRISEYVTVWQFREDTSLYVDCLEQTIREDPDHQGLFRLCKYSGGLPLDQQTCTKRFKATSHSLQSVTAYFAMRGFSLEHIVEGSMITHTTSADGQTRSGYGVQYIFSRLTSFPHLGQDGNRGQSLAAADLVYSGSVDHSAGLSSRLSPAEF